jgi:hypothetical protein
MSDLTKLDASVPKGAQRGSIAHVAAVAKKWLKARDLEKMHSRDPEALALIAESLDDTNKLFWDVVRYALDNNASIPSGGVSVTPEA